MSVFIAGRGAVSAFGRGRAALESGIFSGARGVRAVDRLRSLASVTSVAGEYAGDDGTDVADDHRSLVLDMARAAAEEALAEATHFPRTARSTLALVVASTKGELDGIDELESAPLAASGLGNVHRFASRLGQALEIPTPPVAISCACASGLAALSHAARMIMLGQTDHALVVGADALTPFIVRGFASLLALDPEPCRPFDRSRAGINLGDGAAALVLSRDSAMSIGFELSGWGASNDANHLTGPSRDGVGLSLAIERALHRAALAASELDYVHLHGTATSYNDATEARAISHAFGGQRTAPASGTKAQTGHTLGAAGILESVIAVAALERGVAPANVGLRETDVDPNLDLVSAPRDLRNPRHALKLSAGFGGINAAIVLTRSDRTS